MDTQYATFNRPDVAAVTMTRGPLFISKFAASIRHDSLGDGRSCITYKYNFSAFPNWLAFLVEPIVGWVFHRETWRRLAALKQFMELRP